MHDATCIIIVDGIGVAEQGNSAGVLLLAAGLPVGALFVNLN